MDQRRDPAIGGKQSVVKSSKHIFLALAIGAVAFVLWEMIKVWRTSTAGLDAILMAPWNALSSAWSTVTGAASSISQTASNVSAGNAAAAQVNAMNNSDYAPGGTIYNQIAATQGTAAANQAWQTVQNNQATEASQTVTLNPLSWI